MNGPMTMRYNDRHRDRQAIHQFVEFLRGRRIFVVTAGVRRPIELTPMDISRQIDAWQRVALDDPNAESQVRYHPVPVHEA